MPWAHLFRPLRGAEELASGRSVVADSGAEATRAVTLVAANSGRSTRPTPWEISFKGTLQTLKQFLPILLTSVPSDTWCEALLTAVATHVVGQRPDRFEPRRVKRRPKPYKLLQQHRRLYTIQDE